MRSLLVLLSLVLVSARNLRTENRTEWIDICSLYVFPTLCADHRECFWHKEDYQCEMINRYQCSDRKNQWRCHQDRHCHWDHETEECQHK